MVLHYNFIFLMYMILVLLKYAVHMCVFLSHFCFIFMMKQTTCIFCKQYKQSCFHIAHFVLEKKMPVNFL